MQNSAEMRWFASEQFCSRMIIPWFNNLGKQFTGNSRSDLYLAMKDPGYGIKLRDNKLEIKVLRHDWGELTVEMSNTGKANLWCKYQLNMMSENADIHEIANALAGPRTVPTNEDWVRLDKDRMLVTYAVDPEKGSAQHTDSAASAENGCNVELTKITVNCEEEYYSFALESFGSEWHLRRNLDVTIREVFSSSGITGLTAEASMSYPEFLSRL